MVNEAVRPLVSLPCPASHPASEGRSSAGPGGRVPQQVEVLGPSPPSPPQLCAVLPFPLRVADAAPAPNRGPENGNRR